MDHLPLDLPSVGYILLAPAGLGTKRSSASCEAQGPNKIRKIFLMRLQTSSLTVLELLAI